MSYATASITSATPVKDLMTALNTQLVAGGLTLVETYNTFTQVYKSPAAGNQFGSDWYLILRRASDAATTLFYQVAEGYDAGTHKASNVGGLGLSVFPLPVTFTNPAIPATPDTVTAASASVLVTTSAYTYWVSANANRVIVGVKTSVELGFYAGLYDDLLPTGTIAFPLVCSKFPVSQAGSSAMGQPAPGTAAGGFTRESFVGATANAGYFEAIMHNGYLSQVGGPLPGNFTPLTTTAALYGNANNLSRAMIGSGRGNYLAGDAMRGLLIGCVVSAVTSAAGDTTTVGGKTYTRFAGPATTFGFFVDQSL